MAKEKTVYVCSNCGQDSPKWVGKCPSCGMWNTYVEEVVRKEVVNKRPVSGIETAKAKPVTLHEIVADDEPRIDLHDAELNRVLGGGLVQGSLVLIGGEPGIGKSTLVLQTVLRIPEKRILYVSGEESTRQLKLRADRLTSASSDCQSFQGKYGCDARICFQRFAELERQRVSALSARRLSGCIGFRIFRSCLRS